MKKLDVSAFDFFLLFGEWVDLPHGASLDQVAQAFFDFSILQGADENELRNYMVCDRLAKVRGGKLPAFLQISDPQLKAFRKSLRKEESTAPKEGIERGTALLYQPLQGVYVDYTTPHPVTGEYDLHIINL
jgi:hypothetical protein